MERDESSLASSPPKPSGLPTGIPSCQRPEWEPKHFLIFQPKLLPLGKMPRCSWMVNRSEGYNYNCPSRAWFVILSFYRMEIQVRLHTQETLPALQVMNLWATAPHCIWNHLEKQIPKCIRLYSIQVPRLFNVFWLQCYSRVEIIKKGTRMRRIPTASSHLHPTSRRINTREPWPSTDASDAPIIDPPLPGPSSLWFWWVYNWWITGSPYLSHLKTTGGELWQVPSRSPFSHHHNSSKDSGTNWSNGGPEVPAIG